MLGFFRLGFLDVVLSRALLRGFVTAVAVVIAVCVQSLKKDGPRSAQVVSQRTINTYVWSRCLRETDESRVNPGQDNFSSRIFME